MTSMSRRSPAFLPRPLRKNYQRSCFKLISIYLSFQTFDFDFIVQDLYWKLDIKEASTHTVTLNSPE